MTRSIEIEAEERREKQGRAMEGQGIGFKGRDAGKRRREGRGKFLAS